MKLNASDFRAMKNVEPIPMLTAYNCPVARCLEKAGIPILLVGDTVGMVEMGFDSTRHVTLDHIEYHLGAVRRGAPGTHIIGDLPYNTYVNPAVALQSSKRLLDAGADSIKLEGPECEVIRHLVDNGIDVIGHTGLTPQTSANFKKVGVNKEDADRVLAEAKAIEQAGAFILVLEHIPSELGKLITETLSIPTIGIGAGPDCDGQVMVIDDALGWGDRWPPFSKQYAHLDQVVCEVARTYKEEVTTRKFPNNILQFTGSNKT